MDDSPIRWTLPADDLGEAQIDRLLQIWFQRVLDEPVPTHFTALLDRLEAASGG